MLGLLDKARTLRKSLGYGLDGREEFTFDPDSGISRDEQREIRQEIEKVASQSRMAVSPDMFVVKAAKRGVFFPIMVNAVAVIVLAAGLALFYFLFQRSETQAATEDTSTITAEGKLLEAVKQESDAKLQEKNQQINKIQDQLTQIDKQRQDLQSSMDAKVQEKESQLKAAMDAELAAEKDRLQKQGLSQADIDKKIADLEAQKNTAYAKQLDAFKAQAEDERKKSEATLKNLQDQFNADLTKANSERQQVLAESKQKEADLQAQLTAKTKELATAQAQTQAQLAALSSQKEQEDLASQQLVGLYSVAQTDMAAKNYTKALTSLQAITSYVNAADVAVLPGMARRRAVDLFIVDSLTSLVQSQIDAGKVDTASLVEAAGRISDVRSLVANADGLLKAGKIAEAETQYGQALSVIPEIAKSYAYFTQKSSAQEEARVQSLRAGLAKAETAFAAGRSADVPAAYKEAFAYLPETSARLSTTLSNIGAAAVALDEQAAAAADQKTRADQTAAAGPIMDAADALVKQARFSDAIAQYLTVLQSYPLSRQAPQAVTDIGQGVAGLDAQAAADQKARADQVSSLTSQLADVQKQLDASLAEILSIKKSLIALLGLKQDPSVADSASLLKQVNQRFGDLTTASAGSTDVQKSLDAAVKKNADLTAQVTKLGSDNARLTADLAAAKQETERQRQLAQQTADALKAAQSASASAAAAASPQGGETTASSADLKRLAEFESLVAAYLAYARQEDQNLNTYGQQKGLMLSVGSRDSFLASLGKFFDGILGRMKRYEVQSSTDGITTGRRSAIDDVISVMTDVANQKTPDAQKSYLEKRIGAEKDAKMKSLLGYLQKIVSGK